MKKDDVYKWPPKIDGGEPNEEISDLDIGGCLAILGTVLAWGGFLGLIVVGLLGQIMIAIWPEVGEFLLGEFVLGFFGCSWVLGIALRRISVAAR